MSSEAPTAADVRAAYAHLAGAQAMAPPRTRRVTALRELTLIWRDYRRDAGIGAVGPAHAPSEDAFTLSEDERRDPVLRWLAANGSHDLSAAAGEVAMTLHATRSFAGPELETLEIAQGALPSPASGFDEDGLIGFAATLRRHPAFAETAGEMLALPGPLATHTAYRAPEPGGCWAANLALLTLAKSNEPSIGGVLARAMFRLDLDEEERRAALRLCARDRFNRSNAALFEVHRLLAEGDALLATRSKASRTRRAWEMVVAFGTMSRGQLARSLGLSRAGSDLIAGQLEAAGLVSLSSNGRIDRADGRSSAWLPDAPTERADLALRSFDEALEELERVLARTSAPENER